MDLTYAIDGIITYHAGLAVVSDGLIDGASNHSDSYEREWSSFPAAWTANVQSYAPEWLCCVWSSVPLLPERPLYEPTFIWHPTMSFCSRKVDAFSAGHQYVNLQIKRMTLTEVIYSLGIECKSFSLFFKSLKTLIIRRPEDESCVNDGWVESKIQLNCYCGVWPVIEKKCSIALSLQKRLISHFRLSNPATA